MTADAVIKPEKSELDVVIGALVHAHIRQMSLTEILVLLSHRPDIQTAREFDEAIAFYSKEEAA